jgi:hypothetical protein
MERLMVQAASAPNMAEIARAYVEYGGSVILRFLRQHQLRKMRIRSG